jgi:hypothetical protein
MLYSVEKNKKMAVKENVGRGGKAEAKSFDVPRCLVVVSFIENKAYFWRYEKAKR